MNVKVNKEPERVPCPESGCRGHVVVRNSQYGPFLSCSAYPACQYKQSYKPGENLYEVVVSTKVLRARQNAYRVLSALWKTADSFFTDDIDTDKVKKFYVDRTRQEVEAWLQDNLGVTLADIRTQADPETCEAAVCLCLTMNARRIHDWFQERKPGSRTTYFFTVRERHIENGLERPSLGGASDTSWFSPWRELRGFRDARTAAEHAAKLSRASSGGLKQFAVFNGDQLVQTYARGVRIR